MRWKCILIITGGIFIGFLTFIKVLIIAILGFNQRKHWMAGIVSGLLVLLILLIYVSPEDNSMTDNMVVIGVMVTLASMIYSRIVLPGLLLRKKQMISTSVKSNSI